MVAPIARTERILVHLGARVDGAGRDVSAQGGHRGVTPLSSFLVRIDPWSDAVLGQLKLPGAPTSVAVGFGSIWVTDTDFGTLVRIDPD